VIDLLGRLHGGLDQARRAQLLERFELDPAKRARTYSKGNRQKVALVAALASDAELLILDEPTSGLDPLMEAAFRQTAEEERARGRTILLSSHILSEVEALCDRVTIIRAGRTVETGTLTEMRHLTRTSIQAELAAPPDGLGQLHGVHDLVTDPGADGGSRVRCEVDSEALEHALRLLVAAGVRTLTSQPPTLEELFLRHYAAQDPAGQDPAGNGPAGRSESGRNAAGVVT
jgi:ABC-2 type transport system ATP-binding protein